VVLGNLIGTDIHGTAKLGNFLDGVFISDGALANTIGGTIAGSTNVISGNSNDGVELRGANTNRNLVLGNLIGTDINGIVALRNSSDGVQLDNAATTNMIGGIFAQSANVISGNDKNGVEIDGIGTSGNVVLGNLIGTDIHGTAKLGNQGGGVLLIGGPTRNTIGGAAAGAANVVSANGIPNVEIDDGIDIFDAGTSGNVVLGNLLGTDIHGTANLGNAGDGVFIFSGATANTIGGAKAGDANVLSGNNFGIEIAAKGTSGNLVLGNLIGTDRSGTAKLGNLKAGVAIEVGAAHNTIGGTAAAAANVIAGNHDGVEITNSFTSGNVVIGNRIGTGIRGTGNLGNSADGVVIEDVASLNTIGGTAAGSGNIIAFNAAGVVVSGSTSVGDRIEGNSIFSNTGPGIDLNGNGFTANGTNPRAFPNHGQNFPILTAQTTKTVSGTLTSTPKTSFRLEFFASPATGPAGQGKTFLGFLNVTTSSTGTVSFTANITAIPSGSVLTATATNLTTGDTSEFFEKATHAIITTKPTIKFSTAAQVVSLSAQIFIGSIPVTAGAVTFTIQGLSASVIGTVSSTGLVTVKFTIPAKTPKGAHAITAKYDGGGLFAISNVTGVLTIS
jgi:titin